MSRFFTFLCFATFLFALFITLPSTTTFVNAQDDDTTNADIEMSDDVDMDMDEDIEISDEDLIQDETTLGDYELISYPGIETFVHFPDYPVKTLEDGTQERYKFPAGEDIVVYIGFQNSNDNIYFNISYVGAQLHSPFDFNYYIQNFTTRTLDAIVGPNAETTVEYRFRPDPTLQPIEFQLSGWLLYNGSDGRIYQSTFINTTIELLEHKEPWSFTRLIGTLIVFAVLGGIGYGSVLLAQSGKTTKRRRKPAEQSGTSAPAVWNADKVYKPSAKATPRGKKSSRKASSKKESQKKDSTTQVSS
jgi:hypothetical protein